MARLPLGMGVRWRAHPPAVFSPSPQKALSCHPHVMSCLFPEGTLVERRGCVHVWSGVKRNATRNTNLQSHIYPSQLRCFSFPPSAPFATVDSREVRKSAQISGAFVGISRNRQLRPQWDVVSSWSDSRNNFLGELKAFDEKASRDGTLSKQFQWSVLR